ncbi:MAG: spore coat associated protein CotJA [Lachnospiraceae bacterium]|nr:spore coat associated protein CotJA [Lachnospiraceae bacterium]
MNCNDRRGTCRCDGITDMSLGNAYVPWQQFVQVFEADKALKYGSIFAELVLPFYGSKAACASGRRGMCESCRK